jgi:hypothetical protein
LDREASNCVSFKRRSMKTNNLWLALTAALAAKNKAAKNRKKK